MYSLEFSSKEFYSIEELIDWVVESCADPNYQIMKDGRPTGEMAIDLIQFQLKFYIDL